MHYILAAGDTPSALCVREFGDGTLWPRMKYNGRYLTEESSKNIPAGARLEFVVPPQTPPPQVIKGLYY